jgi:hypothetical protein
VNNLKFFLSFIFMPDSGKSFANKMMDLNLLS